MNPLHFTDFNDSSFQSEPRSLFGPSRLPVELVSGMQYHHDDQGSRVYMISPVDYVSGCGVDGNQDGDGQNWNEYYDEEFGCDACLIRSQASLLIYT